MTDMEKKGMVRLCAKILSGTGLCDTDTEVRNFIDWICVSEQIKSNNATATPQISTVPTLSRFSAFVLSNHSVSHTDYHVLYKVLSCVPTAPSLPPGKPALSVCILRSDCVSHWVWSASNVCGRPRMESTLEQTVRNSF